MLEFLYMAVQPVTPNPSITTMPFAVRPLREADIPQVRAVEKEAFSTLFPPTSFRRELGNRAARYWVAEKRDGINESSSARRPGGLMRKLLRSATSLPRSAL